MYGFKNNFKLIATITQLKDDIFKNVKYYEITSPFSSQKLKCIDHKTK